MMTRNFTVVSISVAIFLSLYLSGCSSRVTSGDSAFMVIGGVPADRNPSVVALVQSVESPDTPFCGGTLIEDDVVLTAAHCVDDITHQVFAVIGANELSKAAKENIARVISVVIHPDWKTDDPASGSDLALLFLNPDEVRFTKEFGKPAVFGRVRDPLNARVYGWGYQSNFGFIYTDSTLQMVDVPINSVASCRELRGPDHDPDKYTRLPESVICAGDLEAGGYDSCEGDSGGPLFAVDRSQSTDLIGIISWGTGCAQPNSPGIYTKVSFFTPWIQTILSLRKKQRISKDLDSVRAKIKQNCFVNKEMIIGGTDQMGKIKIQANPRNSSTLSEEPPMSGEVISTSTHCRFNQEFTDGSTSEISLALQAGKIHGRINTVWIVSFGGENFYAETPARYDLETDCIDSYDTSFWASLTLEPGGKFSGEASANNDHFHVSKESVDIGSDWKPIRSCSKDGLESQLLQRGMQYALKVSGHNLATFSQVFLLEQYDQPIAGFDWLRIEPKSADEGQIVIKNTSQETWYTLEFQCPFPMTLVDAGGEKFELQNFAPNRYPITFSVQWRYPATHLGVLRPGVGRPFQYRLRSDQTSEDIKECELNGREAIFASKI